MRKMRGHCTLKMYIRLCINSKIMFKRGPHKCRRISRDTHADGGILLKKYQYDAFNQEFNIGFFGIPARKYKDSRGSRFKFTYRAAAKIIQIDRGVNYGVNYTITYTGPRLRGACRTASRKKKRRTHVGREGRREMVDSEWHRLERRCAGAVVGW